RNTAHLNEWLIENNITGICGVDTRSITRYIRTHGAQNVIIHYFDKKSDVHLDKLREEAGAHPSQKGLELAAGVSCKKEYTWDKTKWQLGKGYQKQEKKKFKV